MLLLACLLAPGLNLHAANAPPPPPAGIFAPDPGIDLWNEVRQRDSELRGTTQVRSTDADILINTTGQSWREYRMEELIPTAAGALLAVIASIVIFRIVRGRIQLENGRSGIKLLRFTSAQRLAHWSTAILFVILGITGLTLLLGRSLLIPVFGAEAFSSIAVAAKFLHDYLGPLFMVTLTFLFVLFVRDNIPSLKLDLQWVLKGGGLFGKHAHADRYNAGEKLWFWIASIVGLVVVISGMVLDFPIFGQTRATMEFYHWIHSIGAVVLIVVSIGHIYMGTAAVEATFEVMQTGYCDANWAKEHHDLWYEKVKDQGIPEDELNAAAAAPQKPRESTDSAY